MKINDWKIGDKYLTRSGKKVRLIEHNKTLPRAGRLLTFAVTFPTVDTFFTHLNGTVNGNSHPNDLDIVDVVIETNDEPEKPDLLPHGARYVYVGNNTMQRPTAKRILLHHGHHAVCVDKGDEDKFINDNDFRVTTWLYMRELGDPKGNWVCFDNNTDLLGLKIVNKDNPQIKRIILGQHDTHIELKNTVITYQKLLDEWNFFDDNEPCGTKITAPPAPTPTEAN